MGQCTFARQSVTVCNPLTLIKYRYNRTDQIDFASWGGYIVAETLRLNGRLLKIDLQLCEVQCVGERQLLP